MTTRTDFQKHRAQGRGRKTFWILVAVLGVISLAAAGRGFGRDQGVERHGGGEPSDMSFETLQQHLQEGSVWLEHSGLTAEQQDRLASIVAEVDPASEKLQAERRRLADELAQVLEREAIEPAEVERLRQDSLQLTEQAMDIGFDALFAAAQVLTPEQRAEMVRQWREKS